MDPAAKIMQDAMELVKPIDEATLSGTSDIQCFYRDATLFFTGGTGFIGKQLIEKLFRSCDIKKVYVLIRPKKGKAMKERLQAMLTDSVFDILKKNKPGVEDRIVGITGDVTDLRLGISDADWDMITREVNMIYHVAATIRFDETIRTATLINVRGTRETLALGKACKQLRSFVYVSTAYSHATSFRAGREVHEQFYDTPVPPATMINLAENVNDDTLDRITSNLIKGWPNTYTFTKAIAEELVHSEAKNLKVCVVRPSIVLCTYREPEPGWLDMSCVFGPSGLVLGVGMGILRVLYLNNKAKLAFVPADFVNNATIAAGWEAAVQTTDEPKIYHVSTTNCGVTFRNVSVPMRQRRNEIISAAAMWYCFLIETHNRLFYFVLSWLLHYIPAYVVDGVMFLLQLKKPKQLKSFKDVYAKVDKMSSIFQYFLTNEWNFDDKNLDSLWNRMSKKDRTIYNFDMKCIDWEHYTLMWTLGIRKYIMKDGLKTTREGNIRQMWFKIAHYTVIAIYLYIFYKIISSLFLLVL